MQTQKRRLQGIYPIDKSQLWMSFMDGPHERRQPAGRSAAAPAMMASERGSCSTSTLAKSEAKENEGGRREKSGFFHVRMSREGRSHRSIDLGTRLPIKIQLNGRNITQPDPDGNLSSNLVSGT